MFYDDLDEGHKPKQVGQNNKVIFLVQMAFNHLDTYVFTLNPPEVGSETPRRPSALPSVNHVAPSCFCFGSERTKQETTPEWAFKDFTNKLN